MATVLKTDGAPGLTLADLAELVVTHLELDMDSQALGRETRLMGEDGLGLDSVDCLELAVALQKLHRIRITQKDTGAFQTLGALYDLCVERRGEQAV